MTSESRIVSAPGLPSFEVAEHNCFACGTRNTHGLGMTIHVDRGRAWSELILPARFEGWEGIAHGGIIATLLDEVMGWSLAIDDLWGVTARMSVQYRRPLTIGAAVRVEGWMTSRRRRLIETGARIVDHATGAEVATAEGTYVEVDPERKRELHERYGFTARGTGPSGAGEKPVSDTPVMVAAR